MSNIFAPNISIKSEGRYAVADSQLKAADWILAETPFAYGPKSESAPLCLGCLQPVDCTTACSKCSWPICSEDCKNLSVHQANECGIFANAQVKFKAVDDPTDVCLQYECITALRVLLAKERDVERWQEELNVLETYPNLRKTKPIWDFNQTHTVNYLREICKLDRFSEDLIHKVCGILEIYSIEATTALGYEIRCLYPKFNLFGHDCVSNIHHVISSDDFQLTVKAAIDIPQDGKIVHNYTYSLWPTMVRRESLMANKYLDCKCKRCEDKTELGTHLSSLKCSKCDNGVILSTDPLSFTCDWNCTHCEFKTNAALVKKVYSIAQTEIDNVSYITGSEGIESREAIYRKYRSVFHPKNAYMTILRTALTQLYGRAPGYTIHELPDLLQERKVELCTQLLEVLDAVEPGLSRMRGITLYELHAPLINLARNEYTAGSLTKADFRQKMENAADVLRQAVEILKNEDASSNEGQLGVVAKESYDSLIQNFELLIETA